MKTTRVMETGPDGRRRYVWTIRVEVSETWVEDGFDFSPDRVMRLEESLVSYAIPQEEVSIRVMSSPPADAIRIAQGYQGAK